MSKLVLEQVTKTFGELFRPETEKGHHRRTAGPAGGGAEAGRAGESAAENARAALWRSTAARGAGAGDDHPSRRDPVRRTALQPRCQAARERAF